MSEFKFERTQDMETVRRIMTHPRIYQHITDDGCPVAADFKPTEHPSIWHVLVHHDADLIGLFVFHPQNTICYEVHTCLLPSCWGPVAGEAACAVREWMWANSPARRIVTNVPAYNTLAARLASLAGMSLYGVNPSSFLKGGRLYSQDMMGVSKDGD